LNHLLQAELRGQRKLESQTPIGRFFVGDKVMQIRNNYDKQVFNGDMGIVENIDEAKSVVAVNFDGSRIDYSNTERDELVLAYAITIHKSQGNEYPAVVLPLLTQHYIMLYRNLLYTAITRAKKYLVVVGSTKALSIAVKNIDPHCRNTFLKERIQNVAN
jgi:exodeoxyribonuclease V alpha subunit